MHGCNVGFEPSGDRLRVIRVALVAALATFGLLAVPVAAQALSWSGATRVDGVAGVDLTSISCPSSGQCTAVDPYGREVTFAPNQTVFPNPVTVDPGRAADDISCPFTSECTEVDDDGVQATFDPQNGALGSRSDIDGTQSLNGIACLSSTVCVAVDDSGTELEFSTVSGGVIHAGNIDPGNTLQSIACLSATQCVAVDGDGNALLFDPANGSVQKSADIDGNTFIDSVACPSSAVCIAVDGQGGQVSFDPNPGGGAFTILWSGTIDADSSYFYSLNSVACISTTECVAVDQRGAEYVINPTASGSYSGFYIDGSPSGPDYYLPSVSCVAGGCVATNDAGGAIGFNPMNGGQSSFLYAEPGSYLESISCPSSAQCTAVDYNGYVTTFNPASPASASPQLLVFGLIGVACPTTSECVAVDASGEELTFNPASPAGVARRTVDAGQALNSVACPAATVCVAVDDDGRQVTFDPTTASAPQLATIDSTNNLTSVSCPTTSQCSAVDTNGDEVTFNPGASTVPTPVGVDSGRYAASVSCAAATLCTVVDYSGYEVAFNPVAGAALAGGLVDPNFALTGVSCPATTLCEAVDYGGNVLSGNPTSPGGWTVQHLTNGTALQSISCAPTAICGVVDGVGEEYTGSGGSWFPVPGEQGPPSISGTTVTGQTLTEGHGSWTYSPTSFLYQWEDCNTSGTGCTPIAAATGPTYTLTAADVGHTVVVEEAAVNATGTSAVAASAPTAIVASQPIVILPASASISKAAVHRLTVSVTVSCGGSSGETCAGAITLLSVKKTSLVVGSATYELAVNTSVTVAVHVNSAGRKSIGEAKHYKLETLVQLSGSGNTVKDVTLKYARFSTNPFSFSLVTGASTKVEGLQATGLPRGAHVLARCTGSGCSFKKATVKVRKSPVDLESLVEHSSLHKARLTLEATASGYVGDVYSIIAHGAGQKATFSHLCLPPGDAHPRKCL